MPAGRPTDYKEEYIELARNYCLLGSTNAILATYFDVVESTIDVWITKYPEFKGAIKEGREQADSIVAKSLYQRALGYSHEEDKIFNNNGEEMIVKTIKHYPPDPTSMIFWLKNRQRVQWRDRQELEVIKSYQDMDDEELAQSIKRLEQLRESSTED